MRTSVRFCIHNGKSVQWKPQQPEFPVPLTTLAVLGLAVYRAEAQRFELQMRAWTPQVD
jgi:hypothetical protein